MGQEAMAKGTRLTQSYGKHAAISPRRTSLRVLLRKPSPSGLCTAAVISEVQETGVVAAIKHFVANDQEHERMGFDALVTYRALREIYLLPFMIVVKDAGPGAVMMSYNRVNGCHVTEDSKML